MDIEDPNVSLIYIREGAAELPRLWDLIVAQRNEVGGDEWVEKVKAFLRSHSHYIGTPNLSAYRTHLYQSLANEADLQRLTVAITQLVKAAEAHRVRLERIDQAAAARITKAFGKS